MEPSRTSGDAEVSIQTAAVRADPPTHGTDRSMTDDGGDGSSGGGARGMARPVIAGCWWAVVFQSMTPALANVLFFLATRRLKHTRQWFLYTELIFS